MCITSYDQGDSENYGLAYNFHSTEHKHSIEIRIEFNIKVEIPSVAGIWRTADWHEREAYDMMGIIFSGHPNFKRILLPEDWVGYPLRKDFPLTGHNEVRYSEDEKKVIYESVKLEQDYRNFDFESPWEGTKYIKEQTKK